MKTNPALFVKILMLVITSQLFTSCSSYQPLVRNQNSKPMEEIIKNVSFGKLHMVKLKTGLTVKIKILRLDDENIYGTLFQKDASGVENSYEDDEISISNISFIKVREITVVGTLVAIALPVVMISVAGTGAAGSRSEYSRLSNISVVTF